MDTPAKSEEVEGFWWSFVPAFCPNQGSVPRRSEIIDGIAPRGSLMKLRILENKRFLFQARGLRRTALSAAQVGV